MSKNTRIASSKSNVEMSTFLQIPVIPPEENPTAMPSTTTPPKQKFYDGML